MSIFYDNNIWYFILAFIPAMIYSFFIYTKDKKNIKLKPVLLYLLVGFISIFSVEMAYKIFPNIHQLVFLQEANQLDLINFEFQSYYGLLTLAFYAIIQVGLLEESCKFIAWEIGSFFRKYKDKKKDSLFSIMFYACMISVGFACIENFEYFVSTAKSEVVIIRSLTCVIIHMICGIFLGYFLALSRLVISPLKKLGYKFLGLSMAVIFHGFFDYLLMIPSRMNQAVMIGDYALGYISSLLLLVFGMFVAMILGKTLLSYSSEFRVIQKRHNQETQAM